MQTNCKTVWRISSTLHLPTGWYHYVASDCVFFSFNIYGGSQEDESFTPEQVFFICTYTKVQHKLLVVICCAICMQLQFTWNQTFYFIFHILSSPFGVMIIIGSLCGTSCDVENVLELRRCLCVGGESQNDGGGLSMSNLLLFISNLPFLSSSLLSRLLFGRLTVPERRCPIACLLWMPTPTHLTLQPVYISALLRCLSSKVGCCGHRISL